MPQTATGNRPSDRPFRTVQAVKFFGTLGSAKAFNGASNERVWAQDTRRTNGKGEYIGKTFLVATVLAMYNYLRRRPVLPSVYEVISTKEPCRLYLDIEMAPEEGKVFTEEGCDLLTIVIRAGIRQYIQLAFPRMTWEQCSNDCILQACDSNKYSIHYIQLELLFDNAVCSAFAFVFELQVYMKSFLTQHVNATGQPDPMLLRALAVGIIDLSVYRASQQFRLIGNTKLGKARPLKKIVGDGLVLFPRAADGAIRNVTFASLCPTYAEFVQLLVNDKSELAEASVVSVRPHPRMPIRSVHRAQLEIYKDPSHQPDDMNEEARMFVPSEEDDGQLAANAAVVLRAREAQSRSDAGYNMIDDDETIVLDTGAKVLCRDLVDGQIVFCPLCETQVDKTAGKDGKWIVDAGVGVASASCIERMNGQMVIYCFNCSFLTAVIQCADQYGFVAEGDEVVQLGDARKINWQGRRDISFEGNYRLYFLDAPMGTGKTHAVREYLNANPALTVLSITFRQSLARYLAGELSLNCYLDDGFWGPAGLDRRRRCVVCLDSIHKLDHFYHYDAVVIDECVFVEYHFLAGTITNLLPQIMQAFQRLLTHAGRVICMQHRIPDTTIAFYMSCMDIGAEGYDVVRRKVSAPVVLHPMKVLTSRSTGARTLTAYLVSWYTKYFDRATGRSTMPTVVFTTKAAHAGLLLSLLRNVARERFGDLAADRIKGIWAGVQDNEWVKSFLAHPNSSVDDADVLITTSVLQAGHSLDRYFRVSFDFLFRGVLSFREELQFTSRLRYLGREDMAEYKFCWIPAGGADAKRAGKRRLRLDIEQAWDPESGARFGADFVSTVKSIYVPLKSELADSFNRHYWLHKTEFRLSQVRLIELDEKALIGELEEEGIEIDMVTDFTKSYTAGISSSITRFLVDFGDEYTDDFLTVVDESVDLGDVTGNHITSVVRTLSDYVKVTDVKERKVVERKSFRMLYIISYPTLSI
jgi:Origin of replication binding protein